MTVQLLISADRTKYAVTKVVDGKSVDADRFDPKNRKAREECARLFGVTGEWLLNAVEEVRAAGHPKSFPVADPVATSGADEYVIRGIKQSVAEGRVVKCEPQALLGEHLPGVAEDEVIQWKGEEGLVCLDVDYHTHKSPPRDWLTSVVFTSLVPKPAAWHFSRGGGLHLFYKAVGPFTADDLAGSAALRFRLIDQSAGLELKTMVRGPGAQRVEHAGLDDTTGTMLGDWVDNAEVDESVRDEWLDSEEMALGGRYTHDKCPINPTPGYTSKNDPVVVSESGVYCHRCAGEGLSIGSRRPGYASWPALLGGPTAQEIGPMIRQIAHWGHARWILMSKYDLPEALARKAYRAALKAYHHDRPSRWKVENAFDDRSFKYARVGRQWYNVLNQYPYPKDIDPIIATFPKCLNVTDPDKGTLKSDPARVAHMRQNVDLDDEGYPPIDCIHGFKMAAQWLGPQTKETQVRVVNPELSKPNDRCNPRYLRKTERMSDDKAWETLGAVVPHIDRTLVTLALVAFGCAQETRAGLLPITFVEGPSGTAKTSTLKVAAGIYGSKAGDVVYNQDDRLWRQSVYRANQVGPAILMNELLKDTMRAKGPRATPKDALDPLLNLTPDSEYRGNYRDPVAFGRIMSIWVTEPQCPPELREETQLARRIRHYRVSGSKEEWVRTISRAKLPSSDLQLIRRASEEVNRACDAIISSVCDEFFEEPRTWDDMADSLGVKRIIDSPNFEDKDEQLRYFFKLVCEAPDLDGRQAKRHGRGYKKIVPNASEEEDELSHVYRYWADGASGSAFAQSRRLTEKDWPRILGAEGDIRFDMRHDGHSVFVRFARGPVKDPKVVNAEVLPK